MVEIMNKKFPYEVRTAFSDEWNDSMELAWRTFLKFEASDYTAEGIENFNDFVTDNSLFRMYAEGKYPLFVAVYDKQIIGMITIRNENHISLLFVEEEYHHLGVGRALIQCSVKYIREKMGKDRVTVFAAPYGREFYHKLGFEDLGPQMQKDGILYTPMEYRI